MSEALRPARPAAEPKRGVGQILKSYFYWTYRRGSFPYDVMVTLILLFIFITPRLWDYGARSSSVAKLAYPIQIVGDGDYGMIVTVPKAYVKIHAGETEREVKKALLQAIEPITGDAVFVVRWKTVTDADGNLTWKIWAHR